METEPTINKTVKHTLQTCIYEAVERYESETGKRKYNWGCLMMIRWVIGGIDQKGKK